MSKKTVIINRAVPGSGKTTITNCVVDTLKNSNLSVVVHSTDEYFMVGNRYVFDIEKLSEYHNSNFEEFTKSIQNGVDVVICDNTNLMPWQTEPYTKVARDNNYQIIFITLDPRELEKHIDSQKVTQEKPDAHGVDEEILKRMIDEYYIFDDLLNPKIVIDENRHIDFKWSDDMVMKIRVGVAKHFDLDYVIRILPDEYREIQKIIGIKILNLIQ